MRNFRGSTPDVAEPLMIEEFWLLHADCVDLNVRSD